MTPVTDQPRRREGRRFAALALAAGVAVSGVMVWTASHAVFTGYTTNPGNSWTTGTVTLTDNDSGVDRDTGTALFAVTGLVPTTIAGAVSKCIKVTYTGNTAVATAVKLYANANADSAPSVLSKLHLKVETGDTSANVFTDCTGFT